MRTRRFTCTFAATLTLLAVGCGQSDDSAPAVAWTDQVCSALAGFTTAVTTQPAIDRADPVATMQVLDGYLGSTTSAVQTSISALDSVGTSPVDGGDDYVGRLRGTLTQVSRSFDTARTQLAGIDRSSPTSINAALPTAMAPLQGLGNLADPTEGLRSNGELREAAEQAPSCRELRSVGRPAG